MGRPPKEQSVASNITDAIKNFDLDKFKASKFLDKKVGFKVQEWLPLSPAFNEAISLPGLPHGHVTVIRGHSDTGKTTAMIEAAVAVQKAGKLPVLIITEMKWSFEHAKVMGLDVIEEIAEDGSTRYKGNFIYVDKDSLSSIEDVAGFISDLLNEQKKGNLPVDLVFLWDSVGSIPCQLSLDSGKNNAMWNAGAMSIQFGNFINQQIIQSRKPSFPFTNSLIVVNKIRVDYPMANPMEKPKMRNKGGDTMYWDATIVVTFGNITNSGVSKIKATKNGREVEFAKRVKVAVDKNHITNVTTKNSIIMTAYGFIPDDEKALKEYKKLHSKEWLSVLGDENFEVIEESEMKEDVRDILDMVDNETEQ